VGPGSRHQCPGHARPAENPGRDTTRQETRSMLLKLCKVLKQAADPARPPAMQACMKSVRP